MLHLIGNYGPDFTGDVHVSIFDLTGQRLQSYSLNFDNAYGNLNTTTLTSGSYFLHVQNDAFNLSTRFVIQK